MARKFIFYILCENHKRHKKLQEELFKNGFEWLSSGKVVAHKDLEFFGFAILEDCIKFLGFQNFSDIKAYNLGKQITLEELKSSEFQKRIIKLRILGRLKDGNE